ncbi:hypothetical protein KQX54_007465 [Cotesia glomerata]|uniref:Uncharacterized protein n=1 Tax=Cotesia glomerata TaxID=32391 RepID=A0AAV7IFV1_COTGL|nr:hypothetical protein KQX54_007465 [Cotesia glomerata]
MKKRGTETGCLEWRKSLQEGASGLDPEQGTPDGITTRGEHVMVQRVQNSRASIHVSTSVFWPGGPIYYVLYYDRNGSGIIIEK